MKSRLKQKIMTTLAIVTLSSASLGSVLVSANTNQTGKPQENQTNLTLEQAKEKALQETKTGDIIGYEQKVKKGKTLFEITILNGKNKTEIKLDARSGNILKTTLKDLSTDQEDKLLTEKKPTIELAKAEELVKEKYPKASIKQLELDAENKTLLYEVELLENDQEIKIKLDAESGTFSQAELDD